LISRCLWLNISLLIKRTHTLEVIWIRLTIVHIHVHHSILYWIILLSIVKEVIIPIGLSKLGWVARIFQGGRLIHWIEPKHWHRVHHHHWCLCRHHCHVLLGFECDLHQLEGNDQHNQFQHRPQCQTPRFFRSLIYYCTNDGFGIISKLQPCVFIQL